MKNWLLSLALGLLPLIALAAALPAAPPTVVYLVRHGEKDITPGLADPLLTTAGEARAQALADRLTRERPAALFTTDTRRTRATLAPLAQALHLTPLTYSAKEPAALATRIGQEYAGQTVVVVGHSNTLLPLLAALGVREAVADIPDDEYSNLYKVTLRDGKPAKLEVSHYGKHLEAKL
ncbi:histidine phosphatase family protein [Hymenobacter sp. RP-2-7]|uniref:Histidine phosphatase family protein n=1 Tax=Hymenobacter polaris TaxID=2682546 RepID=A0A7Y0AB92_9BACT|nr:histidine phosphatase family protein [Hymenobacter polaris]NML64194.1 histidine phosphatase family protein [Hymenobacter polaris]